MHCLIFAAALLGQLVPNPSDPPRTYLVALVQDQPTQDCRRVLAWLEERPLGDGVTYRSYSPSHPRYRQVVPANQRLPAVWLLHQPTSGRDDGAVVYAASGPNLPRSTAQLRREATHYMGIFQRAMEQGLPAGQLFPRPCPDDAGRPDRPRLPSLFPDSIDLHPRVTHEVEFPPQAILVIVLAIAAVAFIAWQLRR